MSATICDAFATRAAVLFNEPTLARRVALYYDSTGELRAAAITWDDRALRIRAIKRASGWRFYNDESAIHRYTDHKGKLRERARPVFEERDSMGRLIHRVENWQSASHTWQMSGEPTSGAAGLRQDGNRAERINTENKRAPVTRLSRAEVETPANRTRMGRSLERNRQIEQAIREVWIKEAGEACDILVRWRWGSKRQYSFSEQEIAHICKSAYVREDTPARVRSSAR